MPVNYPKSKGFQKKQSVTRNPLTQFELFTGGKVAYPEFTIFYNIAFFRVAGVINHFLGNPYQEDKNALEKSFAKWLKDAKNTTKSPVEIAKDDKVFTGLHNYLWKGFHQVKNPSSNYVTQADKDLIVEFLAKLEVIRNFHSHYYHDNSVLAFSNGLKNKILDFHDDAILAFSGQFIDEFATYRTSFNEDVFFKRHNNQNYITSEGKTFFLSFFLTRSEMAHFLQQRKGYKRADTAEFKIKHLIYCHYTHRDGAARQHYGQTDNVLSTLSAIDQKDILNARQAFKLISYLNDVPPVCADTDLFPLFLDDKAVETPFDFIHFCQQKGFFTEGVTLLPLIKYDDENEDDFTVKENFLVFEMDGYKIQVSKYTLHKLILDAIRLGDKGAATVAQLKVFVTEREEMYELATNEDYVPKKYVDEYNEDTLHRKSDFNRNDELKEYHRYKLRNKYLQEDMGDWLEKLEKRKEHKAEKFIDRIKTSPIAVKYYDFYFKKDEKPRPTDLFTRFAVKYLIDFQKMPDWYWLFEKYEMVEKTKKVLEYGKTVVKKMLVNERKTFYSNVFPEYTEGGTSTEPRLAMTDDGQIVLGVYSKTCDTTKPPTYKFLLGHRAIKNLLIAESENKVIKDFFMPIVSDIQRIRNNNGQTMEVSKLALLRDNELPQSFKSAMNVLQFDDAALRKKAQNRIDSIIREIEPLTDKDMKNGLTNSDKNRQIMRCYKYFDWVYDAKSEYKFLRQDEYQRMSVYHYCLDKRKNKDLECGDFAFLIKDALPHTPNIVKDLLFESNDIDDLLAKIGNETINLLLKWKKEFGTYRGAKLQNILSKLGVPSYRNSPPLQDFIPFDIHPMLVVRSFYPDKLNEKYTSISRNLWVNPMKRKGLIQTHYNYENYFKAIQTFGDDEKKIKKYVIGAMNELKTQDILLWRMAQDYLKVVSPAYQNALQWEQKEDNWQVGNLRNSVFKVPFFNFDINGKKINKAFLSIKFHQMDDYLFVESNQVIENALKQVLMRFLDTNQVKTIQYEITKDAKGFYIVPYQEVFKEIQRVYNDALHWARYILDWERNVIDAMSPQQIRQFEQDKIAIGYSVHINFEDVCSTQNLSADILINLKSKLRNKTFHAEIPDGWAYWQIETDAEYTDLRQLLGYQPKIKFDYENKKA